MSSPMSPWFGLTHSVPAYSIAGLAGLKPHAG